MNVAVRQDGLYDAFASRDTRFDGRFFVGVSSTGIYCRPVCRARTPKEENCTFYESAAEAEQAGYRPCLICRPEIAPGRSITDARSNLARRAAQYIAMRAMEWPDSFLETDIGIKHALDPASPNEILAMAEAWRPWRSYATINLWNSLTR